MMNWEKELGVDLEKSTDELLATMDSLIQQQEKALHKQNLAQLNMLRSMIGLPPFDELSDDEIQTHFMMIELACLKKLEEMEENL